MASEREIYRIDTCVIDSFHPGEMEESVSGARLEHVQLGRGRFRGSLLHAQLGDSRFDWGDYNLPLLAVGAMPDDAVTLGLTLTRRDSGIFSGTEVRGATPVLMTEGTELDYRLAAGTRWMAFQVGREQLEKAGLYLPAHCVSVIDAGPGADRLSHLFGQAADGLRQLDSNSVQIIDRAGFATAIRDALFGAFCTLLSPDVLRFGCGPASRVCALRLVQRVSRYLEAHYDEPVLVETLCAVAGASWKTLERAFLKVYGLTPKGYLTHLRLSRARRLLLKRQHLGHTVAQIASGCGFAHLGRFASSYQSLYGERPSHTGIPA